MIDISGIFNSLSTNLSMGGIFSGIWEDLLAFFISVSMWVLGLIRGILTLIFDIAAIDFFGEDVIGELLNRVYIIIGVLMLFKITISCLQYLINPDKSEDKENGFGAIAKRTIFAIALLALVPSIFNFAKTAQTQIVAVLPRVILGTENAINTEDIATDLAYSTALGFFGYSDESCNDGSIGGLAGASSSPEFNSIDDIVEKSDEIVKNNECNGKSRYSFNYLCFFAGVFLVFILISMALDIGIRTIKLGFLQLIAPIPIASYIDPKSSKKSFDSWVHNSVSVYADLFIRLGIIYLVLYLFEIILGRFSGTYVVNGTNIGIVRSQLVNVAIIIALFMFAKSAPKFICDVLGIKAGEGGVADMFKRAGGFAGAGLGGLASAYSNYKTQKGRLLGKNMKPGKATIKSGLSAVAGAGSALGRGAFNSLRGKGFKESYSAFKRANAARDNRNDRIDNLYNTSVPRYIKNAEGKMVKNPDYYGKGTYMTDRFNAAMGVPSSPGYTKFVYDKIDKFTQDAAAEKSFGATKMLETPNLYQVKASDGHLYTIASARSYADIKVGTEVIKPNGIKGEWTVEDQARAQQIQQEVEKRTSYIKAAHLYAENDPTARMNREKTCLDIENNRDIFNFGDVPLKIEKAAKAFAEKNETKFYDKELWKRIGSIEKADDLLKLLRDKPKDKSHETAFDQGLLLEFAKSLGESLRTDQYAAAQAAEARDKKTQAAKKDK